MKRAIFVSAILAALAPPVVAQVDRSASTRPDLAGVYEAISDGTVLPGGLRNSGSTADLALTPAAADQLSSIDLSEDPAKNCQPVGPFRMMARDQVKIEVVPAPNRGLLVLLFEDVSRGLMRTILLNRSHPQGLEATWLGHSTGRWEGDVLVIDTIGFNDRTWLNDAGAQHSDALRLVERVRPVLGGSFLEYRVTATDPKALAKPHTYTRYFERLTDEIHEDVCEE